MTDYKKIFILLAFIFSNLILIHCQQKNPDWTHFRGSNLSGIADNNSYRLHWTDSSGIAWKVPMDGKGWSSPVVYNNQVWITNATVNGKEMFAICLDFQSGQIVHKIKIFEPDTIYRIHAINSYATPTPCIEEGSIYVHFGRYGTGCIDTKSGEIIWKRKDLQCEHVQGPGSSVIIHKDKLIVHMEGTDVQYIMALDKKTGKTIWKTDRPAECYEPLPEIGKKAYITPIVINLNGRDLLISNGSAVCIAYDVETGEEVWRIVQGEDSTIAMPVESNGILYFYTSFITPEQGSKYCELLAVDPSGEGDIGKTNVFWRLQSPSLQLLTPVIKDGLIYTINSKSILQCIDSQSGEIVWSDRLNGKFNSSPISADGHLYFNSTRGETIVIEEGTTKKVVAQNSLKGEIWATPAFVNGSIIMRTSEFLYKIESP